MGIDPLIDPLYGPLQRITQATYEEGKKGQRDGIGKAWKALCIRSTPRIVKQSFAPNGDNRCQRGGGTLNSVIQNWSTMT